MIHVEIFRDYCLAKPAVTEHFPFGEDTLVFKVGGKMFALAGIDNFNFINLKCDPERAIELRESHVGITPGYHMNKKLWNSVSVDGSVADRLIFELIDHSYSLIVEQLPLKVRREMELDNAIEKGKK